MGLVARIVTHGAQALVSYAFVRAIFEICYRNGFYPERWLADLTVDLLSDNLAFWLLASFLGLAIWLILEFVVRQYWRNGRGGSKMSSKSDSDRPPPKELSEFKNAEEMLNYRGDIISPNWPVPLRSPAKAAEDAKKFGNPAVQIFDSVDVKVDGVSVPEGTPAVGVDRSIRPSIKNITVRDGKSLEKP